MVRPTQTGLCSASPPILRCSCAPYRDRPAELAASNDCAQSRVASSSAMTATTTSPLTASSCGGQRCAGRRRRARAIGFQVFRGEPVRQLKRPQIMGCACSAISSRCACVYPGLRKALLEFWGVLDLQSPRSSFLLSAKSRSGFDDRVGIVPAFLSLQTQPFC